MPELSALLEELAGPQTGVDPDRVRLIVESGRPTHRTARVRRRRPAFVAIAAAATIAVVIAATILVTRTRDSQLDVGGPGSTAPAPVSSTGVPTSDPVLPPSVTGRAPGRETASSAAPMIVDVDATGPEIIDPASGARRPIPTPGGVARNGCVDCPVVKLGAGVVFTLGGRAFWMRDIASAVQDIGAAQWAYPAATDDAVWLTEGPAAGRRMDLRLVDVGTAAVRARTSLDPGVRPAGAALPEGIVTVNSGPDGSHHVLEVWDPSTSRVRWSSNDDGAFVAASTTSTGSQIAWRAGATAPNGAPPAARDTNGTITLSNLRDGSKTKVGSPADVGTPVTGGSLSPDGTTLASFVSLSALNAQGQRRVGLVLTDLRTMQASTAPVAELEHGGMSIAANWSPDGSSLYFVGAGPQGQALRIGDPVVHDVPDGFRPSFTVVG